MQQNQWHLSKAIPVALFLGIVTQGIMAVGAYYTLKAQVNQNTVNIKKAITDATNVHTQISIQAVQLGRIETSQKYISETLDRIYARLNK